MENISADVQLLVLLLSPGGHHSEKSLSKRRPLPPHRFFSYCACVTFAASALRGFFFSKHLRTQNSLLLPLQTSSTQRMRVDVCRSRFMPDLIHRKNESHLGMDRYESRRFTGRGPLSFLQQRGPGPALCCLDQNPPQEYPGMKRNRVTLQVRMSISRQKDSQMLNLRSDQRPGRLISGSQSLRRRLSSQNRCSFSRAGSSQEPSAGFCAKRRRKVRLDSLEAAPQNV